MARRIPLPLVALRFQQATTLELSDPDDCVFPLDLISKNTSRKATLAQLVGAFAAASPLVIAEAEEDDDTPSIEDIDVLVTANANATTITTFDDATEGKLFVVIIGDANTTIDFTGTNLHGNAGVDWTPDEGDFLIGVMVDDEIYCLIGDTTASGG